MALQYYQKNCKCEHGIEISVPEVPFIQICCQQCSEIYLYKIDQYNIKRLLGSGAMGAVYLAENVEKEDVAIKVIENPEENLLDHFIRECLMQSKLEHKNIVKLIDQGHYETTYYIVQEYLEGHSLDRLLEERGLFPVRDAVKIVVSVLNGLRYAAKYDIVHRDIKPANIYITCSGEIKILDLGLAKIIGDSYNLTSTMMMKGSPLYMPHEQYKETKNVDARADIYAVGATLYELLCGAGPFSEYKFPTILKAKKNNEYKRLLERKQDLPQQVVDIVEKAMALEPEDRYQNAEEMAVELLSFYKSL